MVDSISIALNERIIIGFEQALVLSDSSDSLIYHIVGNFQGR